MPAVCPWLARSASSAATSARASLGRHAIDLHLIVRLQRDVVSGGADVPPGKRKRDEAEEDYKPGLDALPFSVRATTPTAWTDLGGGLKVRNHDAAWLSSTAAPSVGVRMCGGYDNRATIVAPSSRVLDALGADVGGLDYVVIYA